VTKLLLPFEPDQLLADLAAGIAKDPESLIEKVHLFPLGGIKASAEFTARQGDAGRAGAARAPQERGG
jgi:methylenetetrahydrofolate reductase (NADPH)